MIINLRKVSSANIEQVLYFLDKNKQEIHSKKERSAFDKNP
jgi:hypothetical protein